MRNILKTASIIAMVIGTSAAYASPLAFPPDAGQNLGAREISTDRVDEAVRPASAKPASHAQTVMPQNSEELQFMRATATLG